MNCVKVPRSLRSFVVAGLSQDGFEAHSTYKVTVGCLVAVASITGAQAQQTPLAPVTVDAPVARKKPPAAKPSAEQLRARAALRRAARAKQTAQAKPVPAPASDANLAADRNPYADPAAPYKVDRLASPKFTEPVLNTPKTITVLTKELLADKNATSLREVARTTAGVTLGSGEGGNAFGDRFFIRGFDARNDVFLDGIRDPAVSIRENFFTEQIEILRGPASSYAGRGTAGGGLNIVTKQAGDRNFYEAESTFGNANTKRFTMDVNQVISPTLSVRVAGLDQNANVVGRDQIKDNRLGGLAAVKWTPVDTVKITANYFHSELNGTPDFGVPYYRPNAASTAGGPFTEFGVARSNWYGFVNRDFQKVQQDVGTAIAEWKPTDSVTFSTKFRSERAILNYIGTLPESPVITNPNPLLWTVSANPQSRYQVTDVLANQTDATFKFYTGPVNHAFVTGIEASREKVSIDSYSGLSSEALPGGFSGTGSLTGVNIYAPQFTGLPFSGTPALVGNPTVRPIDTDSAYVIDTANYQDFVILNGGLRYDHYIISSTNNMGSNALESGLLNYNAGLVVKPLPNASIYGAYATSSNPVGAELDGATAQYGGLPAFVATNTTQLFSPELNKASEVGTKWELFDRHLLATAALFQTEKDNARELGTINGVANTVVAGAAYRIRGIDLGVAGKITQKWSVFGGLVLMQSEVLKSLVPPANTILYTTNVGLPLANIAHQSFNLLTKYQFTEPFEAGAQATYVSKIYGGTFLAANQGTSLPDHWRFDAFAEYKLTQNFKAKLNVTNILNKTYYDSLYQSAAPFVMVAPGRTITASLQMKF